MAVRWDSQALREPISAEQPCGENLDDTNGLAAFDARLFGQTRSPEAPPDPDDGDKGRAKARPPLEWERIREDALDGLTRSKDLRLLAYLGTALLRTDGLPAFAHVLTTAAHWLEAYWPHVYPLLDDDDAIARRNALNCLADPMAVVDRVWRLPLIDSRQHGRLSLRDIEIARGQVPPGQTEGRADLASIREAFRELSLEDLTDRDRYVTDALAALNSIDARMRGEGGPEVAPDFGPLSTQFAKLSKIYRDELAERSGVGSGAAAAGGAPEGGAAERTGAPVGAVTSRQDAVRALDAVADYFRRHEPSSPIPLLIERAKRLVAKDFLEVLADIAPDAVPVARSAGGLRDQ